jgi:hypothetical protein
MNKAKGGYVAAIPKKKKRKSKENTKVVRPPIIYLVCPLTSLV